MKRTLFGDYYASFGLRFFSGSVAGVVDLITDWIRGNTHAYVCVTGAHGVVESSRDVKVLRAHKLAGLVVPDGMPLVWLGRLMGYKRTERIYGPDLFLELCRKAEVERWGIFLYGTTEKTLRRLSDRLLRRYPRLHIVGSYAPPFRHLTREEDTRIVRMINATKARIVFVGLSTPKQELWMQDHARTLRAHALVGVGAAFDFVAGAKRQAPRWIQQSGFEWLFRFFQEPHRLWYRAFVLNTKFIVLIMKSLWWTALKIKVWKFFLTLLVNILLTGLLLGLVEFAVRLATDRGLISYYHPIQIETFADASAQVEDWRLTHMYRDEQFVPDSVLFWKPKSGVWRYNNDGFIGKTTASLLREAKITGGCAIVAIGDSNTQGITDFSWPEELNDFYEKNGRASRVVNAGVAGYSSYQGMQLFTHRVIALSPEIVIVSFGWNDMAPDMGMPDNDFVSIHSRINDAMSVSRLYLIFRQKYSPRPINDGGYHPRVSISEYKDNLNKIILVAKQRNIKIVLLTRPYNSEHMTWNAVSPLLKGGWRKYIYDYNNVVRELAQNHGVSLIDFAEQFSSDSANFLDDSHFASDSSRVAALRVFEGLNSDVKKCK